MSRDADSASGTANQTGPAPGNYFGDKLSEIRREPTAHEVACELACQLKARLNEMERLVNTMPRELPYPADAALRRMFQGQLHRLQQLD